MGSNRCPCPHVRKSSNPTAGSLLPRQTVSFQWVLRDSRGYFVDSSAEHDFDPFIYKVGDATKAIPGFDQAIRGMRKGGRRRFTVPPEVAYRATGDDKPGPMPTGTSHPLF